MCDEKIELALSVEDFIRALVAEAGSPAFVMTKSGLAERLLAALPEVFAEVKRSSVEVV
jgi:hypothetical protein